LKSRTGPVSGTESTSSSVYLKPCGSKHTFGKPPEIAWKCNWVSYSAKKAPLGGRWSHTASFSS